MGSTASYSLIFFRAYGGDRRASFIFPETVALLVRLKSFGRRYVLLCSATSVYIARRDPNVVRHLVRPNRVPNRGEPGKHVEKK